MKIDGRLIASEIKKNLKEKTDIFRLKKIIPQLAVILVGNDQSSQAYVRQKEKVGSEIGAEVAIYRFEISESDKDTSAREHPRGGVAPAAHPWGGGIAEVEEFEKELINLVKKLNSDKSVHGIIIQRPLPIDISKEELDNLVIPQKDVDGFHPKSSFSPPIASAILHILNYVYQVGKKQTTQNQATAKNSEVLQNMGLHNWLNKKRVLVIGRGETAGKPIAEMLQKMRVNLEIAHSKTTNLKEVCLDSDIIITCVGRPHIVRHNMVTKKTILIGVGLHPEDNKLRTDYDQEKIAQKVAFYTPVPGGVGPVNVACLFENLILACK